MANSGDLITLQQALAWTSQTTDATGLLAQAVSAISTQIQNFVGYQFAQTNYTRTLNGTGGSKMLLPDRPVTAVSSLTIEAIVIPPGQVGATSGYLFDTKFIYLYGYAGWRSEPYSISNFVRGVQNVTVSYTAGYATIPFDVQQAALTWLGAVWEMVGQDPTVQSRRAGDTQIDFKNTITRLGGSIQIIPPAVLALIMPYRRVAT